MNGSISVWNKLYILKIWWIRKKAFVKLQVGNNAVFYGNESVHKLQINYWRRAIYVMTLGSSYCPSKLFLVNIILKQQ